MLVGGIRGRCPVSEPLKEVSRNSRRQLKLETASLPQQDRSNHNSGAELLLETRTHASRQPDHDRDRETGVVLGWALQALPAAGSQLVENASRQEDL